MKWSLAWFVFACAVAVVDSAHVHRHPIPLEDSKMKFFANSHLLALKTTTQSTQTTPTIPTTTTQQSLPPAESDGRVMMTRHDGFVTSRPHHKKANCHVSHARPLMDCSGGCSQRGVCGVGAPGDNPGNCNCFGPWAGRECSEKLSPSELQDKIDAETESPALQQSVPRANSQSLRVCYYTTTALDSFDLTSFEMPDPQQQQLLTIPNVWAKGEIKAVNFSFPRLNASRIGESDLEAPPPPPEEEDDLPEETTTRQADIFGQLGTYQTSTCSVWRRNGPGFKNLQGFTIEPDTKGFAGKETRLEIIGSLFCSDVGRVADELTGNGTASVRWLLVHSKDGTNTNYITLAQGTVRSTDGQCEGHGLYEGISIYAAIPKYTSGYVALWMEASFEGTDNGANFVTICDDLKYILKPGNARELAAEGLEDSANVPTVSGGGPGDDIVLNLPVS